MRSAKVSIGKLANSADDLYILHNALAGYAFDVNLSHKNFHQSFYCHFHPTFNSLVELVNLRLNALQIIVKLQQFPMGKVYRQTGL